MEVNGMDEKKIDYRNRWQKENQERVIVMVGKGQKEKIKNRARESGEIGRAHV